MALSSIKLWYKKPGNSAASCNLYTTTAEVGGSPYLAVCSGTTPLYAKLGTTGDAQASDLRVTKNTTTYAVLKTAATGGFTLGASNVFPAGSLRYNSGWADDSVFGGSKLYIVGGLNSLSGGNGYWSTLTDIFDMSTGVWTAGPSTNASTQRMYSANCVCSAANTLNMFGAYYNTNSYEQNMLQSVNGGAWTTISVNQFGTGGTYSGSGGGYIGINGLYNYGGDKEINAFKGDDQNGQRTGVDRLYSFSTNTWTDTPTSSFPVNCYGYFTIGSDPRGSDMWASGGFAGGVAGAVIYKYSNRVWSSVYTHTSSMYGRMPIYYNGYIYYMGGYNGSA